VGLRGGDATPPLKSGDKRIQGGAGLDFEDFRRLGFPF